MPLGDLSLRIVTNLPPVNDTRGHGALAAQHQAAHHFVLGGAVKVDHEELHRDIAQELSWHVVHEGLVEDRIERALLYLGLFLGNALAAIIHVHLHVGI